jgi:hypothetical protein
VAHSPHNLAYASNYDNLYVGLLAELAVVHYLVNHVADLPAEWLSPNSQLRHHGGGHRADIAWNGLELDVKLIAKHNKYVKIKKNAQGFHHVFVDWMKRLESFRILGVLLPYPPETFEPATELLGHVNRKTGPVTGWLIPTSRLQPLECLLRKETA